MADPEVIRGGWVIHFPGGRLQQLGQHTQRVKARLREGLGTRVPSEWSSK